MGRTHSILADQSEAETHGAISRIIGGTYTKSVQPIKNAVFIDDNFSPLVGAVKCVGVECEALGGTLAQKVS